MKKTCWFVMLFLSSACTLVPGKKNSPAPEVKAEDLKPADPVFGPNVLVFGGAELSSSAVQGRLVVGGSARLEKYAVGTVLSAKADRCDLAVAGNLDFDEGSVQQGRICVVGSIHTTDVGTSNPGTAAIPDDLRALAADATALSAKLAALAPQKTIDAKYLNGGRGKLVLTGDQPGLNVFEVTGDALALGTGLSIQVPAGAAALVNVSGDAVEATDLGVALSGAGAEQVLLNFPDATTLGLKGVGLTASVLAPKAAVTFTDGSILGSVVAASVSGDGRFNLRPYTGPLTVTAPSR